MHLKDSVLEGGGNAFYKAYGMNGGEYSNGGFQGVETLVDVGGGNGSSIHLISSRVPTIRKAINFDLPFVLEKSTLYSGVEHVAGDMFESVPKGDAIFMKTSNEATDHKALLQFSLYRMNTKPQGKERTLTQFDSLAKQAGFSRAQIACYAYNFAVFEFIKLETSA
ncbi:Flavone 3'-O-methyltransferase OMT2 [Linum perenne]